MSWAYCAPKSTTRTVGTEGDGLTRPGYRRATSDRDGRVRQVPGSRRVVTAIRFQALIVRIRLISWASSGSVNWAAASS